MFHVPEAARNTTHPHLGTTTADGNNGAFDLPSCEPGWRLSLICSDSSEPTIPEKWEHVSVHAYKGHPAVGLPSAPYRKSTLQLRTPTWREMVFVKDLCWDGEDVVMQLHPRKSEYVNDHPHTLHLWRPINATIPTPPKYFVGGALPADGNQAATQSSDPSRGSAAP